MSMGMLGMCRLLHIQDSLTRAPCLNFSEVVPPIHAFASDTPERVRSHKPKRSKKSVTQGMTEMDTAVIAASCDT